MRLRCFKQADEGDIMLFEEHAIRCNGVWSGSCELNTDCGEYAAPLADMMAITRSRVLRELVWRDGEVEFTVERKLDADEGEIYVQAKLAL